ncbi:hypothetical protein PA6_009_00500 [Aquipseudomonas alcaligenes NBRC 14159]|uniref:Uncharacterized protein n=1 Tax=Aquipseudomonas alcaligenes (strain ATCC 14909 / DSM 50342 / CCUG 1425 / JCM 20561 / NBRC 14159 / NCIMB 9945 / NCTC 10367 / 1577) TaxID=1215092 RepID=U2ZKM7_AQUA1|nr:hypothetical protein PA6_009_00500 [Pseudomonas alcaligenes NBRC 14159]
MRLPRVGGDWSWLKATEPRPGVSACGNPGQPDRADLGHCTPTIWGNDFSPGGFMDHIDNALIRYQPAGAIGLDLGW